MFQTNIMINGMRVFCTLFCLIMLAACAGPVQRADNFIAQDEWAKAVLTYREASSENPTDVEYKSRLKQTELKAADYYYQKGLSLFEQENLDGAISQYQQGLVAMPDHVKLLQGMRQVLLRKQAISYYNDAMKAKDARQSDETRRLLKRALDSYPNFKLAELALANETKEVLDDDSGDRLKISSKMPITLNFRQTDIRTAFEFIAKSFGIDVVFDDGVRTIPVTLFAKDVAFEDALSLILTTTKTFYKKVGANTILIAPDTKDKRGQYEDQMVRVFQLTNIHAKAMSEIIKGVVPLKKIIVNDDLNTIVVRDTEEAIKVVEKVISVNDRRPAELILEVEILEVNRSKAERLGLDLGTYNLKAAVPAATVIPLAGSIQNAFTNSAVLTLPSATFNFYKQDVDAKTLANPRLRVLSGKSAKIHIGDRVPLRAATIQDVTGQVRTTYDYKEIGIRLSTEPIIHLDNSVTVKVGLEVSSLGQNIGTATEPAYSIGTRNAETYMLLRDGETAIVGGLIRDEDRKTRVKIPLLGDIPILGYLFTTADNSSARTDVLLTITPRVVRGWDMPTNDDQMFVSGSEDRLTSQPLFGKVLPTKVQEVNQAETAGAQLESAKKVQIESPLKPPTAEVPSGNPSISAPNPQLNSRAATLADHPPLLAFSKAIYEGSSGENFEIKLTGENFNRVSGATTEILYNPQLIKYVGNKPGSFATKELKVEADEAHGVLKVKLAYSDGTPASGMGDLAGIILKGKKPGTSYVVYREPALSEGGSVLQNVQVRASRIVIK